MDGKAYLRKSDADYKELGIEETPALWEDGMRTTGDEGNFEWWYFDAEYSNGIRVVIAFYTKFRFDVKGPSCPTITTDLHLLDGETILDVFNLDKGTMIAASKEKCDVRIGESTCRYSDGEYLVHFRNGDIEYDCRMKPRAPMWRPKTGNWRFEHGDEVRNFSWFVAQPSADVTGTLKVGGEIFEKMEGIGYHDHNWGDTDMNKLLNHWYWGRGNIGPYSVICCDLVSEKKYGYKRLPVILITRDGEVISDNEDEVVIERSGTVYHPITGKFIDNSLAYIQKGENGSTYRIEFLRNGDTVVANLIEVMGAPKWKRVIAKALGINPTYIRCIGKTRLTVEEDGKMEVSEEEGLWEQMFFGRNKDAIING